MNLMTWILLALIAAWLVFAILRMLRRKGGCSCASCSGNCAKCRSKYTKK